jgi:TrmH RNA methyltransferase
MKKLPKNRSSQPNRSPAPQPPRYRADDEQKICGFHACMGVFQRRPDDIIKVYLTEDRTRHVSDLLRWCAQNRRAYNVVGEENLERLSGSSHHEGIMLLTRRAAPLGDSAFLDLVRAGAISGPLLYLDGVQNPHNLGALLRTAAHFGAAAILGASNDLPDVSAATARVAEGGAEHVAVVGLRYPERALPTLKELGYTILATSSHQGRSVFQEKLTAKTIFVLGGEQKGVSPDLLAEADRCLLIPGTGQVESLNVSVAGAVLLSELYRQMNAPVPPASPGRPPKKKPPGPKRSV